MSASLNHSVLTRLLTLNNQVHDLENQLLGVSVPRGRTLAVSGTVSRGSSAIAEMQEQIDQGVRASLTTCWLGMSEEEE